MMWIDSDRTTSCSGTAAISVSLEFPCWLAYHVSRYRYSTSPSTFCLVSIAIFSDTTMFASVHSHIPHQQETLSVNFISFAMTPNRPHYSFRDELFMVGALVLRHLANLQVNAQDQTKPYSRTHRLSGHEIVLQHRLLAITLVPVTKDAQQHTRQAHVPQRP